MRSTLAVIAFVLAAGIAVRRNVLLKEFEATRQGGVGRGVAARTINSMEIAGALPPSAADAADRLAKSPRHREYVMIPTPGVSGDSIRAWVFYPQVSHKVPVVVVIHEIFGMSTWIKAVGDQVAADGYIAIVPDLIHRQLPPQAPDTMIPDEGVRAVRALQPADVQRDLDAAAAYATHLPSALSAYATVGFCWGGSTSFAHAVHMSTMSSAPTLKASVVYYGSAPDSGQLPDVRAPVLGLYGGNDARISSTVPGTDSAMHRLHKTYADVVYSGAGHGFLRAQDDAHDAQGTANETAAQDAWPRTLAWFHQYLGS
jgi:carboxymethylenebutenolidase